MRRTQEREGRSIFVRARKCSKVKLINEEKDFFIKDEVWRVTGGKTGVGRWRLNFNSFLNFRSKIIGE